VSRAAKLLDGRAAGTGSLRAAPSKRAAGGASAVDTPPGPAQFEVGKVNAAVEVLVWGQRVVTTFARV
jgi:hypothetical protein